MVASLTLIVSLSVCCWTCTDVCCILVPPRHKVAKDGVGLLRERTMFTFQKGKQSRIEQPSAHICDAVNQLLAGHSSPFTVTLVDNSTQLEADSAALASWLRSPAFAPLSFLVHASTVKRVGVDMLCGDDAALEARCIEVFALVRNYEQSQQHQQNIKVGSSQEQGWVQWMVPCTTGQLGLLCTVLVCLDVASTCVGHYSSLLVSTALTIPWPCLTVLTV